MANHNHGNHVDSAVPVEKRLLNAMDHLLEGVQIIGFDWRYIYVNNAMTRHGKYKKEELIGHTVMEKYPGIEDTEVYGVYLRCFNERVPIHMENRFVFPDNSVGWFELSFQPIPEGIFILSVDITQRKKHEEEIEKLNAALEHKVKERTASLEDNIRQLKESEEKFHKAFQASAAGITITRLSDSRYLDVNDAFAKMTGFSREELIGHTSVELGIVANINKREEVLKEVRASGFTKNVELTVRNRSGELFEVLSSIERITLNGEQYAINIIYDITERKKAELELEAANQELESFSSSVSHDLRSPLRIITGYAQILELDYGHTFNEDAKELFASILRGIKKMNALIDGLLAFSRLGKAEIQKTTLDMNAITGKVISDLQKITHHTAVIKVAKLHPANGDAVLINQVMVNLISNAIKYSSKKPDPQIEITSKEDNGSVVYTIKDNGDGFDMQYAGKLFSAFQRLHTAAEFEGTGMGLAIVDRIIKRHGGKVWTEAEPGKGAAFSFTLQ